MTCPECGREFDLAFEQDADEWAFGHDCEVHPLDPAEWYDEPTTVWLDGFGHRVQRGDKVEDPTGNDGVSLSVRGIDHEGVATLTYGDQVICSLPADDLYVIRED